MRMEIDNLRLSSEELMNRKTAFQAEVGALDRQMGCLSNTNRNLSHELDGFVVADHEVQNYLNKKAKVEQIKFKAEEELRITMAETHARKEQIQQNSAMNAFRMTQDAMVR